MTRFGRVLAAPVFERGGQPSGLSYIRLANRRRVTLRAWSRLPRTSDGGGQLLRGAVLPLKGLNQGSIGSRIEKLLRTGLPKPLHGDLRAIGVREGRANE